MPRGTPDWGEYSPQGEVSKSLDLAEIAVRLGSPVIYDRNGTVLFMDTFQYGLIRWVVNAKAECTISACDTKAIIGPKSLKFAFSGTSTDLSYVGLTPPFLYFNRNGYEITAMWDDPYIFLILDGQLYYNGNNYGFGVKIAPVAHKLYVWGATDWITVASDINIDATGDVWYFIKLVVDAVNAKYVGLKLNDRFFDLSAYTPKIQASSEPNMLCLFIQAFQTAAQAGNVYVGSTILTINEP